MKCCKLVHLLTMYRMTQTSCPISIEYSLGVSNGQDYGAILSINILTPDVQKVLSIFMESLFKIRHDFLDIQYM